MGELKSVGCVEWIVYVVVDSVGDVQCGVAWAMYEHGPDARVTEKVL